MVFEERCESDLEHFFIETKQENRHFSEEQVVNFMIQLLKGLSFLHDLDIQHRDLKLKNIFINSQGILKIGDFGGAKTAIAASIRDFE